MSDARMTVDVHCHLASAEVERLVAQAPRKLQEPELAARVMGPASARRTAEMIEEVWCALTTAPRRLRDMDALGIDVQVLSPSPTQYYYWADEALARAVVSLQNEAIAQACAKHPDRFIGLAQVALQHPALAARQLEEAMTSYGLRGAEISSNIEGMELDDPSLDVFFSAAERLGAVVFVHPLGTSLGARLAGNYLANVIGQPIETTIALSRLIFGGVLDRHPRLRLLAAHGGGYLPFYPGRANHAFQVRPDARGMKHPPATYLHRVWFDSVVYEPSTLRHLVEHVGAARVLLGTDYPFDMGSYDAQRLLGEGSGLSAAERALILGENALALFAPFTPAPLAPAPLTPAPFTP